MNRQESIERIRTRRDPWDVVVIGGGATGAGCALDAASRGLDVLLLERDDFGKGTSSRSTKLVHGGVRYLRQGNIALVREALKERGILLRNAPHLVRRQPFVLPCYSFWEKLFYGVGLKIYDLLAGRYSLGPSRSLSSAEVCRSLPNIDRKGLAGGVLYQDCRFDDARLLIDILSTASRFGAAVLNYASVTELHNDDQGRVTSVSFKDHETGGFMTASTRSVINAAGIFADDLRKLSDKAAKPLLTFSQGSHIVLERRFMASDEALIIPKTSDGRVLFCIPWHDHLLVGTTDTPVANAILEPRPLDEEIRFILHTAAEYLAQPPAISDVKAAFAGIRPLVKDSGIGAKTSSLSRDHLLEVDDCGLITVTGGKWTTYRRMAQDAVDAALGIAGLPPTRCRSEDLRIETTMPAGSKLCSPDDLENTVIHTVRHEMARTVEDVLARRTRILFTDARKAIALAPQVAKIMANELGRDEKWEATQREDFETLAKGYLPV